MLLYYADLWMVPFWGGLAVATLLAAIAWGRNSRRAAACGFTIVWLLGVPWAIGFVWNSSAYQVEQTSSVPDARRLDAAESRYRRSQGYGIALGAVFAFSLSALLQVRYASARGRPVGLRQRLETEYLKKKFAERGGEPP